MRCAALLLSVGLAYSHVTAQAPQGTITGTITDAQGARVPNATITALHVEAYQKYTAVSSANGVFAIPSRIRISVKLRRAHCLDGQSRAANRRGLSRII